MPLVRFAHSCHIFMTSQTRGNILYTPGITYYSPQILDILEVQNKIYFPVVYPLRPLCSAPIDTILKKIQ